jgi:hypothetical protein
MFCQRDDGSISLTGGPRVLSVEAMVFSEQFGRQVRPGLTRKAGHAEAMREPIQSMLKKNKAARIGRLSFKIAGCN